MNIYAFAKDPNLALADYKRYGLHVEKNVLESDFCDRLIQVARTYPAISQGDYRTVLQPHRRDQIFLEALCHPHVANVMRKILGGDVSGIQTQFFYGKPGTPGFQPHQDNRFVNAPAGAFASAWIALTDIEPINGGLYVYPSTHLESLFEVEEVEAQDTMLQDLNALRLRCVIPEKFRPVDLR